MKKDVAEVVVCPTLRHSFFCLSRSLESILAQLFNIHFVTKKLPPFSWQQNFFFRSFEEVKECWVTSKCV
jgi:hypothetical protein